MEVTEQFIEISKQDILEIQSEISELNQASSCWPTN